MILRLHRAGCLSLAALLVFAVTTSVAIAQPAGSESPSATQSSDDGQERGSDKTSPANSASELAPQSLENLSPAAAEFERQFAAWQAERDETLRQLQTIRDLPIEERREFAHRTQVSGDLAVARVLAAAEAAYLEDPKNERVENYLLLYAVNSLENDQIEDAARISILLLDHGYDPKVLASVAGRSCLELGRVDEAIKYLKLAQDSGVTLSRVSQSYLSHISQTREDMDEEMRLRADEAEADDLPRVLLETTRGDVVIELFENELPNAVANFIFLVERGFYNDMTFYHVRPQYFSATGCPNNDGTGTAGYSIYREPEHYALTDFEGLDTLGQTDTKTFLHGHQRYHTRGTVSMMALDPLTYSSQFMICHRYSTMAQANQAHMAIGRVIEGMNVVTRLMAVNPRLAPEDVETDRLIKATVIRKRDHQYRPKVSSEVMHELAQNMVQLTRDKQHDLVSKISEIALAVEPREASILIATGLNYIALEQFEEAAEVLERLVYFEPDHPDARRQLALCYIRMERIRDATEQLQELARITPDDPLVFNNLGTMLMRQQRKADAIEAFKKALELKPDYEQARKNLELLQ